jgi:hypothetical protein
MALADQIERDTTENGPGGPDLVRRDITKGPVSSDLVHVPLELDQSTRVSHSIWSTRLRSLFAAGLRQSAVMADVGGLTG